MDEILLRQALAYGYSKGVSAAVGGYSNDTEKVSAELLEEFKKLETSEKPLSDFINDNELY